jgi:hypothetical protein
MAPYEGDVGQGWPQAGKGVDVDRDKLKDIAKVLQGDLDELRGYGKGTAKNLQSGGRGLVTMDELGNYPAATGLAGTTKNAYDVIAAEYEEFLQGYQQVINGLLGTRDRYQRAEDANTDNAGRYDGTTGNATYAG